MQVEVKPNAANCAVWICSRVSEGMSFFQNWAPRTLTRAIYYSFPLSFVCYNTKGLSHPMCFVTCTFAKITWNWISINKLAFNQLARPWESRLLTQKIPAPNRGNRISSVGSLTLSSLLSPAFWKLQRNNGCPPTGVHVSFTKWMTAN